MENYYIYVYLDPRKLGQYKYGECEFEYEPFYVGKGKDVRWKEIYEYRRNKYFIRKINKIRKSGLEPIVFKLYENLNEKKSFDIEKKLIQEIGRHDLKTGPLTNETTGGDGTSGYKFSKKIIEIISKKRRKNFLEIKNEFKTRNYILLTGEKDYKNCDTKLKYICSKGHEGYTSWTNFQQGKGCPVCASKIIKRRKIKNFQEIKNEFKKRGYELLTEEKDYENNRTKLKYICSKGHEGSICWNNFQQGKGCSICWKNNNKGDENPSSKLVKERVIQIKLLLLKEIKIKKIADIFNINIQTIYDIKHERTWSHIKVKGGD